MSSLLRSTKFVRYFTGAARTLILNSAKVEANSLINPKALCAANNVLMRDYATTKKTENLEPLLQKLDSEVRRFGRITKKDIDEVFDEIQSKNNITSSQSLLVIRCCGELVPEELPEQRTLLVQKIWNVLTERGIPMDISHYNALLRVYIENEHPFSPAKFLEELEKKGLQANRVTYQRLMWRYCQEGDVEGATKVLERMRELNLPVSEPVLNALVMGHAFHGDTDGAKAVLETMAAAGLEPSDRTYTLLACGFARKGDIDGVESTLKAAQNKDIYFSDKDILEIIEHLALYNHGDKVEQIFPHLQKGFGYNQEVCNLILRLLNKGQIDTAKKVMKTMPKSNNVEDTIFKGAFFVKQLLKVNRPVDEIVNICRELKQEELVPNAFFIATETALTLGKTELAQRLFKELNTEGVEIRQHYYWPLLVQKGKENDEEGLLQILRDMAANGVPATGEALKDYVLPYLIGKDTPQNIILKLQIANIPVIQSARNLTNELLESGEIKQAADVVLQYRLRKNYASIANPLIKALSKTKDIGSFATILHVLSSKPQGTQGEEDTLNDGVDGDSNNDINEISRIVKNALKNLSKPDLCESLLNAIYSKGLRINTESAQEIEQYLGENMTTSISQLLTKLTSSDIEIIPLESTRKGGPVVRTTEQLESLIARLKEKDGSNITRLQKQLLVSYIKDNNVDKVSSYVEELKSSSFEVTPGTLAQLFEFYCENNEIEKAQQCQEEIAKISPEFELNKFKVIQMVYALVRQNRYDDAINYLKSDKHKADDPTSFLLNSKCWQMLNYLAEQKDSAKVLEMTDVLLKSNVVEPSNILLGPSIKVHLLNDDIDGALKQFETCCKQYSSTPWKGELMKALIMKEDASKLQWLADLSTQVHGEVNILHDLVLAFVECGRLRQARRILETPGLQARHKRLDDACQRYVEEGKSEYLEGLLEATKELSHIDRSNIFYHLLVTYCKANETDKALGLWTILQEEGEVPSDQFLKYLGNHLRSKNREVPFIIPDDKKVMDNAKTDVILQKVIKPNEVSKPTKKEISTSVELLVNDGKAQQAADLVIKSLQNGVIPQSNVFKYLLKVLAESGNVEKVQQLGNYINESMKKRVTYDDKLTLAIFNRGAGPQHVNNILEALKAANTDKDIETALKKFPRSNALASVIQDENVIGICNEIVDIAAKHGITLPANLLWMEYLLANKEKEADALWNKWLNGAPTMVFRRLLQESHTRKQPENIEKLINLLKQNKTTTPVTLGNVYSRLVNYYIVENDTSKAEAVLEECLKLGVQIEHINKTTLKRLKVAVENAGRQFKFSF